MTPCCSFTASSQTVSKDTFCGVLKVSTEEKTDSPKTCYFFCRNPGCVINLASVSEETQAKKLPILFPEPASHKAHKTRQISLFVDGLLPVRNSSYRDVFEDELKRICFTSILLHFCKHTRTSSSLQNPLSH